MIVVVNALSVFDFDTITVVNLGKAFPIVTIYDAITTSTPFDR